MCTSIGANYSAIYEPIWLIFGMLVHVHALYILLIFLVNVLNSFLSY